MLKRNFKLVRKSKPRGKDVEKLKADSYTNEEGLTSLNQMQIKII